MIEIDVEFSVRVNGNESGATKGPVKTRSDQAGEAKVTDEL